MVNGVSYGGRDFSRQFVSQRQEAQTFRLFLLGFAAAMSGAVIFS
jgi:hypothetical protein